MVTLEDFTKAIAGDGADPNDEQTRLAQALFEMHEKDVQGLKNTNVLLKDEKKKLKDVYDADVEKFAMLEKQFQEELEKAKEQIKSNSPEETKKYYEAERSTLEASFKSQLEALNHKIAEQDSLLKDYERKDLLRSQEVEFERRIRKTHADPSAYDTIKLMVLGDKGDKFSKYTTAEGDMFLMTDGSGRSIEHVIEEVLASPVGKRLCNFESSGSGAEGGSRPGGAQKNPFKKETWNETEQMKLFHTNPELARQLKAAASA